VHKLEHIQRWKNNPWIDQYYLPKDHEFHRVRANHMRRKPINSPSDTSNSSREVDKQEVERLQIDLQKSGIWQQIDQFLPA
jgi:hypothetical protein